MRLIDEAQPGLAQQHVAADRDRLNHGAINPNILKEIREVAVKPFQYSLASMERNLSVEMLCNLSEIVDAVAMIGVVVGNNHMMDVSDPGR